MVLYISLVFIVVFLLFGFIFPDELLNVTNGLFGLVTHTLGWFYLASVLGIFLSGINFQQIRKVTVGDENERPEYSNFSCDFLLSLVRHIWRNNRAF